ncbi:hypothetical protein EVAR_78690_1 [Eumeta japonica]|uniref:Uncharacterized protein n=1 Tax=Eumeta variegata TaxID=151549 RepID=A0A4C1U7Y8_EUMVA|nr:hypothetical protein EVAR_78690_1 [Eumeta japonica]
MFPEHPTGNDDLRTKPSRRESAQDRQLNSLNYQPLAENTAWARIYAAVGTRPSRLLPRTDLTAPRYDDARLRDKPTPTNDRHPVRFYLSDGTRRLGVGGDGYQTLIEYRRKVADFTAFSPGNPGGTYHQISYFFLKVPVTHSPLQQISYSFLRDLQRTSDSSEVTSFHG